jgi:hypothetical protein
MLQVFLGAGGLLGVGNLVRLPGRDDVGNRLVDIGEDPGFDLMNRHQRQAGGLRQAGRNDDLLYYGLPARRRVRAIRVITDAETLAPQFGE